MTAFALPFERGGGYSVDPNTVFTAATGFLDTKGFVFEIASGLAGDLSGTGGMAGGDKAGHAFAASYQPAAQAVIAGIDKAGQGMAAISARLLTMAVNYLEADNIISKSLGSTIDVSSGLSPQTGECEPTGAAAKLPQALGADHPNSLPVIGRFWPQGDTGRLRNAAQVWASAAHLIDEAQVNAGRHATPVIYECSGAAFTAFQHYAATLYTPSPHGGTDISPSLPLLENLSAACRLLGKQCQSYADSIDHCKHVIEALGTAAGIITVGGAILSFFTFGSSGEGAAAGDGAIASAAEEAAEALAAAEASSAEAAVVQEAEQIVAQLAAKLGVTGGIAATTVVAGVSSASAATATPRVGAGAGTGGAGLGGGALVGPISPSNPLAFPLYTAAEQKAAAAWVAGLPQRPPNYGTPADRAYQVRIAGEPERLMSAADGSTTVWADGFRPTDGAIIDAKNVRTLGCSPRTLQGLQENSFATAMLTPKDEQELGRYQDAIENPANHAQFLEIDTNDPECVGYWQFLLAEQHVTSDVRYVP